jgi:hypothetical protein
MFEHLKKLAACHGLLLERTGHPTHPWRMVCVDGETDFDNTYADLTEASTDLDAYTEHVTTPNARADFLGVARNQCDGCNAKMPVEDGIHYHNGRPFMGCTADRY